MPLLNWLFRSTITQPTDHPAGSDLGSPLHVAEQAQLLGGEKQSDDLAPHRGSGRRR